MKQENEIKKETIARELVVETPLDRKFILTLSGWQQLLCQMGVY